MMHNLNVLEICNSTKLNKGRLGSLMVKRQADAGSSPAPTTMQYCITEKKIKTA